MTEPSRPKPLLRRVRARTWAWLHFKLALGIGWTHAMLFVTPASISEAADRTAVLLWLIPTFAGAVVSIVGMFGEYSLDARMKQAATSVELFGLALFAGGPFQYLLVQVSLWPEQFDARYALAWFAYAMVAAIAARIVSVVDRNVRPDR